MSHISVGLGDMAMGGSDALSGMLRGMGYKNVFEFSVGKGVPGTSTHKIGGASMGHDKRKSVPDANNRVHDIPNLFVTHGAAKNSCSQSNPSFTYMAMTARAAAFAAAEFKAGTL